jgi:drug/metabolite transporter (DMT)-like permease
LSAQEANKHPPIEGNPAASGFLFLLAALACFATLDTTTKTIVYTLPLVTAVWARCVFQALLTTAYVLPQRGRAVLQTVHLRAQLVRGALFTVVTYLAFSSLKFLPVAEFSAIAASAPLVVTLLAGTVLGERVSAARLLLVCGGLGGTLLIVRPSGSMFGWELLMPFALVLCNASFQLLTRRISMQDNPMTTHFYTVWISAIATTVLVVPLWEPVQGLHAWLTLGLIGTASATGHLLLINAFQRSQAVALMPFMYAQIGFGMLGGWLVFGQIPDGVAMIGITCIVVCGMLGGFLARWEIANR